MDLDAFEWLLTPDGQGALRLAERLHAAATDPVRAASALRAQTTAERAAAALTQAELRERGRAKFGRLAASMYFTREGLEQATRLRVAQHRAARAAAAGIATVLDIGCGIGGDLLAFARAGQTVAGVDLDALRVAVASANLSSLGLGGAVRMADGTALDLSGFGLVYADPARRSPRGRVFDVRDYAPGWSFVESLLRRPACVKVAPGIPREIVPAGVEAEWVSDAGEVKEAALWSSWLATVRRRATVIGADGLATLTDEDDPGDRSVRAVQRYLYEPDGAVVRAGLVTAVAAAVRGGLIDEHIAYVTSDTLLATPYARGFEVVEVLPYKEKALRLALRERHVGRLTIKKRGVSVAPEQLRRRLALQGDEEATLVLTRAAGRGTALLVRPLR